MERKEYFKRMKETSDMVNPFIQRYLAEVDFKDPVKKFVEILPNRRLNRPRLREFLLRLSYQVSGGKEWEKIIPPYGAAVELYNDSTYIVNWFLDGKGELTGKNDEKSAVNAGCLLRELAQKIIESQPIQKEKTLEILCGLSDVNLGMYKGQNEDLYNLSIDNFENLSDPDIFLPLVYEKGRLVCGYFASWITNIGSVLSGKDHYKKALRDFAIDLSSGIQLANDAGDFIPYGKSIRTPEKSYKDQVTDIANGRLTLPIWYCLKHGDNKQKKALLSLVGRRDAKLEEQEQVVYALRDSGAFDFIFSETNRLRSACKHHLKSLPDSEEKKLLSTMTSLITTNKFYKELREKYGAGKIDSGK